MTATMREMMDPIETLSDEQLLLLSADLQVQLERRTAMRPVAFLLANARRRAAKALLILALEVDPEDAKTIRKLQGEVGLYDDMIKSCQALISGGKEARARISEKERAELDEVIVNMTDEERKLHGFEPRGQD